MISKQRLDALTDGVFAVAMTLLIIDLHLPEGFHPDSNAALLQSLVALDNQALVYGISFYVLAMRWMGMVVVAPRAEDVSISYTRWSLLHLLPITFVPFATSLVGRYPAFPAAVWIYAANTVAFALIALRMAASSDRAGDFRIHLEHRIGLLMLLVASLSAIAVSLITPKWALFAYCINLLDTPLRVILHKRRMSCERAAPPS